jgi:hypothetical protein
MKKIFLLFIVVMIGCGKDDPQPTYKFKDQTAAGEIENVAWVFVEGKAEVNGEELSIDLMLDQIEAPCDIFGFPEGDFVFFTVPSSVGLYKLSFGSNSQTATLLESDEFVNIIISEGAIEILTITETEVTGRLDLRFDNTNYINGNFTVDLCP